MPIDQTKIEQINTRSEYFQEILDKIPSRIVTWGSTGIFIIFLLLGLGLSLIKYPFVISSEVLITTDTPPIEGYSRTSGRVSNLLKDDEEIVKAGDWIIVLNNTANYRDVIKLLNTLKNIDPSDFLNSIGAVSFNESLLLGDMQSSYSQFVKAVGELKLYNNLNSYEKQLGINSQRQKAYDSLKKELNHNLEILERQSGLAKSDFERNQKLQNDKVIAKAELEQKEIAYLSQKTKVEELKNQMINSQLQAELVRKENETLRTEKNNSYFSLRTNLLQYYNTLLFELSSWKNKYVIEAPTNGILNLYDIRHKDQFLVNEMKVFTITPENTENYYALIKLPIANSGRVRIGQNCNIKLNNYPYEEFGMIKGTIQSISAAAREGFYSVKVKLSNKLTTTLDKKLSTKSELNGTADIIIKDYTLFERLFNYLITKTS